jgi:hypothetical protein
MAWPQVHGDISRQQRWPVHEQARRCKADFLNCSSKGMLIAGNTGLLVFAALLVVCFALVAIIIFIIMIIIPAQYHGSSTELQFAAYFISSQYQQTDDAPAAPAGFPTCPLTSGARIPFLRLRTTPFFGLLQLGCLFLLGTPPVDAPPAPPPTHKHPMIAPGAVSCCMVPQVSASPKLL